MSDPIPGVVRVEGNESCWLELLRKALSCRIVKYFNVKIYVCKYVRLYGDVH
jgi:hypothetical protein